MEKKNLIQQVIETHVRPVLKSGKKVVIASILGASILLGACASDLSNQITEVPAVVVKDFDESEVHIPAQYSQHMTSTQKSKYIHLKKISNAKLTTHKGTYGSKDAKEYTFISNEDELIAINKVLAESIKGYFKAYGASDWTNPDDEQFWPNEVELLMTAIAWRETEYRTDAINTETNCAGITGLNKDKLLETLEDSGWLNLTEWGESKPYINCNSNEIDVFNPVVCLEYSYYNMGYNLANRLKKDKYFNDDISGKRISVWQRVEYSEEMQLRLIIASHLYGINNVVDSVFERNYDSEEGRYIGINEYIYGDYTNDVLDKYYELCDKYEVENVVIQER